MTPYPPNPLQSRKDIESLISHQTDIPCLRDGCGAESVLAFLMQIYAYVSARFSGDVEEDGINPSAHFGGTGPLKNHLMSSGRYQVVIYKTDFRARPNALRLRQRTAIYNGASIGSWIILWPGAERDTFFKTGRVVSAMEMDMSNDEPIQHRSDGALTISAMDTMVTIGEYRFASSNLPICRKPIRLIPP